MAEITTEGRLDELVGDPQRLKDYVAGTVRETMGGVLREHGVRRLPMSDPARPNPGAQGTVLDGQFKRFGDFLRATHPTVSGGQADPRLKALGESAGNVYHFAVWEDRLPYYTARSVTQVDWEVRLRDLAPDGGMEQDASWLRNAADAYDGTSRTALGSDADSQVLYPVRDAVVRVPSGTSSGRAGDARDRFVSERKIPQQATRFTVVGDPVARSHRARIRLGGRAAVRAGDVLRIVDLVPASAASPALDNIRTFHILETRYDATRDAVSVAPDRPPSTLAAMLARTKIEPER